MSYLSIEGGAPLHGELTIQGSKNSVLPVLAATILARDVCRIENCPRLRDVDASVAILRHLGCRVRRDGTALEVDTAPMARCDIPDELMREMRSSIIFLGAILARQGEAVLSYPGGCELGPRPIDLHLAALRELGAEITERYGELRCKAKCLRGTDITLAIPSVGATENAILAACGAEGTSVIYNAAREPEIVDLQALLRSMGARVNGAVRLTGVDYRAVSTVALSLAESGCEVRSEADAVSLRSTGALRSVRPVRTAPYPGFPTDAQPVLMAALLRSEGCTVFVENIFENRYRHVDELSRMGAEIRVAGRVAVVNGVRTLHGAAVKCTDLRGGAALVIAGLSAEGTTRVTELTHIDRGYDAIERDLAALGAQIRRETT